MQRRWEWEASVHVGSACADEGVAVVAVVCVDCVWLS
jgi:hypothetical protein